MTLVQKIRALTRARGITMSTLEVKMGFAAGAISKWDHNVPGSDKVLKVANYLGTTTDYLLKADCVNLLTPSEVDKLPESYFQLLNGARELDLTNEDVAFLLDIAKRYKALGAGK